MLLARNVEHLWHRDLPSKPASGFLSCGNPCGTRCSRTNRDRVFRNFYKRAIFSSILCKLFSLDSRGLFMTQTSRRLLQLTPTNVG